MADETPPGETPTPGTPTNGSSNSTTPVTDNGSAAVEAANKAAEQERMRANQLANELAKVKADQDAAKQKQLEEKEEFKTLYEKNEAELKQIREEREAVERQKTLATETETVFKDYPASVVDVAKTAGISLSDDSEVARTALKEKLDALKAKVDPNGTVTSNNPSTPAAAVPERAQLVKDMALAGAQGDDRPALNYIGGLDALKQMKRNAGMSVE